MVRPALRLAIHAVAARRTRRDARVSATTTRRWWSAAVAGLGTCWPTGAVSGVRRIVRRLGSADYGDFVRACARSTHRSRRRAGCGILLGDPPVDWDLVRRIDEGPASGRWAWSASTASGSRRRQEATLDRDAHAAQLVMRAVVGPASARLAVFGDGHLRRGVRGVVTRLEEAAPVKVFTIARLRLGAEPIQRRSRRRTVISKSWPAPGLLTSGRDRRRRGRRPLRGRPVCRSAGGDDVVADRAGGLRRRGVRDEAPRTDDVGRAACRPVAGAGGGGRKADTTGP